MSPRHFERTQCGSMLAARKPSVPMRWASLLYKRTYSCCRHTAAPKCMDPEANLVVGIGGYAAGRLGKGRAVAPISQGAHDK